MSELKVPAATPAPSSLPVQYQGRKDLLGQARARLEAIGDEETALLAGHIDAFLAGVHA
jgi:hypothetical protein